MFFLLLLLREKKDEEVVFLFISAIKIELTEEEQNILIFMYENATLKLFILYAKLQN